MSIKADSSERMGGAATGYRKGDRCRILGDFKVEHYDCDEWGDGVVTDVRTGKPVDR